MNAFLHPADPSTEHHRCQDQLTWNSIHVSDLNSLEQKLTTRLQQSNIYCLTCLQGFQTIVVAPSEKAKGPVSPGRFSQQIVDVPRTFGNKANPEDAALTQCDVHMHTPPLANTQGHS